MKNQKSAKKEVSLADVEKVMKDWRKSCEARGEIPVGIFHFAQIDPETDIARKIRFKMFGTERWMTALNELNTEALKDGLKKKGKSKSPYGRVEFAYGPKGLRPNKTIK